MIQNIEFWLVLAVSVPLFWLTPARYRYGLLAAISFGYIATLSVKTVLALLVWSVVFYTLVPFTTDERKPIRRLLTIMLLAIIGFLAVFKYVRPALSYLFDQSPGVALIVPLGISYYTFKLIHYAVEFSRGNIKDRSIQHFLCYLYLFPIFTAGPIERFDHFLSEKQDKWSSNLAVEGITRILHGLIKKGFLAGALLAPALGPYQSAGDILAPEQTVAMGAVWAFVVLSFLISYLDFSAYSDVAIGCSRLFGFRIAENFRFPIFAADISDFWRRWHMTLVNWVQSYVYMPLFGLTRKPVLCVFAVFLTIGIWHAASLNWVAWGLFHGAGVAVHMKWRRWRIKKKPKLLSGIVWRCVATLLTFVFAAIGYVFVATAEHGILAAFKVIGRLFIPLG
ncbi:MAG: hypothetical protein K0U93_03020 [Gammaproteobacteria bacterium]|nr:hypothetical protein [Gammaproteobacteria bacterium]